SNCELFTRINAKERESGKSAAIRDPSRKASVNAQTEKIQARSVQRGAGALVRRQPHPGRCPRPLAESLLALSLALAAVGLVGETPATTPSGPRPGEDRYGRSGRETGRETIRQGRAAGSGDADQTASGLDHATEPAGHSQPGTAQGRHQSHDPGDDLSESAGATRRPAPGRTPCGDTGTESQAGRGSRGDHQRQGTFARRETTSPARHLRHELMDTFSTSDTDGGTGRKADAHSPNAGPAGPAPERPDIIGCRGLLLPYQRSWADDDARWKIDRKST